MILTAPAPVPTSAPAAPAPADPPAGPTLQERLEAFAKTLTASDETLAKMVADSSPVGTGWAGHFSSLAATLQGARDEFIVAEPDADELGAKLGAGVLRLAEASGSMAVFGRQRSTLAEGWSAYLDTVIADTTAAAALLAAPAKDAPPAAKADAAAGARTLAQVVVAT